MTSCYGPLSGVLWSHAPVKELSQKQIQRPVVLSGDMVPLVPQVSRPIQAKVSYYTKQCPSTKAICRCRIHPQHHVVLLQAGLFRNTSHCNAGTGIPQTTLGRALNTLLTPPNHPSHITAVHWFTASDDTSGELTRHGVCAVQVAGIWLSRR